MLHAARSQHYDDRDLIWVEPLDYLSPGFLSRDICGSDHLACTHILCPPTPLNVASAE